MLCIRMYLMVLVYPDLKPACRPVGLTQASGSAPCMHLQMNGTD